MPNITWQERLDLTLPIKKLLRRARDTPRFDDREPLLQDLMGKAIDLPLRCADWPARLRFLRRLRRIQREMP